MLRNIFRILCFAIPVFVVFLLSGNTELNFSTSIKPTPVYSSHTTSAVSQNVQSFKRPEIREDKIKIRYMSSECNYYTAPTPEIRINPELAEETKHLNYVSLVNVYFLDSFHLRGPPSIA